MEKDLKDVIRLHDKCIKEIEEMINKLHLAEQKKQMLFDW
jgi:hypothetical protein